MARLHDQPSKLLAPASKALPASTRSARTEPLEVAPGTGAEVDVLSDVLRTVKLTGALFFPLEASSPWADEIPAASVFAQAVLPGTQHVVSYHIVTHGTCWATILGGPTVHLEADDILVVPHGDPYVLSSALGVHSGAQLGADDRLSRSDSSRLHECDEVRRRKSSSVSVVQTGLEAA